MSEDNGTWIRPRGQAWGNEAQRAVLHAIAEDIARRSGHKVVAIEVLRSDGYLEFVAIAGDDAGERDRCSARPPRCRSTRSSRLGGRDRRLGATSRASGSTTTTRAWLEEYGHRPDVPAPDLPDGWHPDDQLVRLLENEDGELRGAALPRRAARPG